MISYSQNSSIGGVRRSDNLANIRTSQMASTTFLAPETGDRYPNRYIKGCRQSCSISMLGHYAPARVTLSQRGALSRQTVKSRKSMMNVSQKCVSRKSVNFSALPCVCAKRAPPRQRISKGVRTLCAHWCRSISKGCTIPTNCKITQNYHQCFTQTRLSEECQF